MLKISQGMSPERGSGVYKVVILIHTGRRRVVYVFRYGVDSSSPVLTPPPSCDEPSDGFVIACSIGNTRPHLEVARY